MPEFLKGTSRKLYSITVIFILVLCAIEVGQRGLSTNVSNLLIFTVGSVAAVRGNSRWAETKDAKETDSGSESGS